MAWGKSVRTGSVGRRYTPVSKGYSDLCLECGAVVKSYIKQSADMKRIKAFRIIEDEIKTGSFPVFRGGCIYSIAALMLFGKSCIRRYLTFARAPKTELEKGTGTG